MLLNLMTLRFEWDRSKAGRNAVKHGVTFEEAATVFRDPLASIFADETHSGEELRETIIGYSAQNRLLIVSFAERGDVIRIVSARKADADERTSHEAARR
jgi:hypothetical protein